MGIYALILAGSNYFAPVVCGFVADGQGWQWVFYYPAIFLAVLFVFLFFFMEETNYVRAAAQPLPGTTTISATIQVSDTKMGSGEKHQANELSPSETESGQVTIGTSKTLIQKLALWGNYPGENMLQRSIRSLRYLGWPVIFYAGFSYGSYLIWFNVLNATASIILGGPGYNFRASMVGLSYVSCCIGVIIGAFLGGKVSDWLTIRLARRNKGIMEAEHRLWPFIICLILVPFGLILWGVGAAQGIHWFGLIFAMCILALSTTMGVSISVNYMIDSYHDISGDAIVTVILVRNTMSFAISYG
jgi:MFS family permease